MLIKKIFPRREAPPAEGIRAEFDLTQVQARKRRRRRWLWRCLVVLILLASGIVAVKLYLRSPIFRIREIVVEGNSQISRGDVILLLQSRIFRDSWWSYVRGFTHAGVWPDELTGEDLRFIPAVKHIAIRRNLAERRMFVTVTERESFGVWCFLRPDPSRCVWFDREGIILDRAPFVEGGLIVRVSDYAQDPERKEILPEPFLDNLFSILRVVEAADLVPLEIRLEDLALQELKILQKEGPEIYFSLRFPSSDALGVIQSLRRDGQWSELIYLDFRSEHRAYYK